MDLGTEIVFDALPYIRVYKSGRVERPSSVEVTPPAIDGLSGVSSKDILAIPSTGVSVRLYLPRIPQSEPNKRLPLLVYFHGGAFCIGKASNPQYHNYLNTITAEGNVIIASVDYRLAPENPIPVPFNDSWAAFQWVASHAVAGDDEWLTQHADFDNVYLAGESAGATIAHHVAMRSAVEKLDCGVHVSGLVLIHPYFLGKDLLPSDMINLETSDMLRNFWLLACPSSTGFDDPHINPMAIDAPTLSSMVCTRVLVCIGGLDTLRDRGRLYYEGLRGSGWGGKAELLESEGEGHCFHLFNTTSEKALQLNRAICLFLNSGI